ncbi:putative sporulation transcription regulator WhiA [Clostridium sp. CAG:230]|nr:putative sporulation transcription regulator WhiA [Clostridium sp. CAG:230]
MSFSRKVKEELVSQTGNGRHCLIAEFAAIFALTGKIRKDRYGDIYLEIRTENLTVARKSYILIGYAFCVKADIRVQNHNIRANSTNYCLIIKGNRDVLMVLKAIKVIDDTGKLWGAYDKVHQLLVQNTCCKRAYLRGAFLVAGSITNPQKAYHLEIATASEEYACSLQKLMQSFSMDAKIVLRKKYFVLYIKEGTQIVDFLNVIEAHIALMDFENVRILKEVRNSVNRQVNCETANINKTVTAAAKQIEDIQYLQEHMGFSQLADGLKEIAELRLEYPDSSLVELGKMLSKPIGKSGVNHRLRKISEFAEQLREKNGFVAAK